MTAQKADLSAAYAAGTAAIAHHGDKYDTIRDIAVTVIDAAAPKIPKRIVHPKAPEPRELRRSFLKALANQLELDVEQGRAAERGFTDGELQRFAKYLKTYLC